MAPDIYQAKQPVPPAPVPQVKLKTKPKPLEAAEEITEYLSDLSPVFFTLSSTNVKKTIILPPETAEIFYKEGLLNEKGEILWQNQSKVNNSEYVQDLENKILLAIILDKIKVQIFTTLRDEFDMHDYQGFTLDSVWGLTSRFLAEYYAPMAAAIYASERYPDVLTKTKILNRLPIDICNQTTTERINKMILEDKTKIQETIEIFLDNSPFKNKIINKKELINKAVEQCQWLIPYACYFDLDLSIAISTDPQKGFQLDILSQSQNA
jgi:hypothetical protein